MHTLNLKKTKIITHFLQLKAHSHTVISVVLHYE